MAEITRDPYVFTIDAEHLRVSVAGVEVACAALSQVTCEDGRHYVILPELLMNANFSPEEWDVLNNRVSEPPAAEPVVEQAVVDVPSEEPVAEEAPEVVAPAATSRRGRRRF